MWYIVSYFVVQLPLDYLFAFYFDMQLLGIWVGRAVASYVGLISYLVILSKIDYDELILVLDARLELAKRQRSNSF